MKIGLILILLTSLVLISTTDISAQSTTSAAQNAENLRLQLSDVQAKEAALQSQAQQLDEALKPENIERYFQLIGSTRPEELREQRRRQLSNEKTTMLAQLEQLAASRARLESAIHTADALAYQQSAQGAIDTQHNAMLGAQFLTTPRWQHWWEVLLMLFFAILGILALLADIRRRQLS